MPKGKRRVSFPCRKHVFFRTNELQRSQQSLVSGVCFPEQVSRPPAPSLVGGWFGLGSPGCRRCAQAGKTGRDIKGARVWKRKTRVRCRGNASVNRLLLSRPSPGGSTRGFISNSCPPPLTPRLLFWVECDTPRCPRLIMRSGIAHWWLDLLTSLLQLDPNAEGGSQWKQYFSRGCYKGTFLKTTIWPRLSGNKCAHAVLVSRSV